jgi:hypothetical protein
MLCPLTGQGTKGTPVTTLRRLAALPTPTALAGWRAELLAAAVLAGGLVGMATGAY